MKELKKEMNEIIIKITEEELLQNIKNTEERIMNNNKINKRWMTEEEWGELSPRELRNRELGIIHRTINKVINLMEERNELYEVRLIHELQEETEKIERMKKQLELFFIYETQTRNGEDQHIIKDLANVIGWIEEEQEKYRL